MAKDPWLETFPIVLKDVVPLVRAGPGSCATPPGGRAAAVAPIRRGLGAAGLLRRPADGDRRRVRRRDAHAARLRRRRPVPGHRLARGRGPDRRPRRRRRVRPSSPGPGRRRRPAAWWASGGSRWPIAASDGPLGRALRRLEGREPAVGLLGASAVADALRPDRPEARDRRRSAPRTLPGGDLPECGPEPSANGCGGCSAGSRPDDLPNGSACWLPRAGGCRMRGWSSAQLRASPSDLRPLRARSWDRGADGWRR